MFETVIALIIFFIAVAWVGWPVIWLAEDARMETGEAFLLFLAVSALIFVSSLLLSLFITFSSWLLGLSSAPAHPQISYGSTNGMLPGHAAHERRVKVYDTHWIAGFRFVFAVIPWPGEKFRIYILEAPSYGRRSSDAHTTHRFDDGPRRYICILPEHYPNTITDARELALMWAQATAHYIKTGKKFS